MGGLRGAFFTVLFSSGCKPFEESHGGHMGPVSALFPRTFIRKWGFVLSPESFLIFLLSNTDHGTCLRGGGGMQFGPMSGPIYGRLGLP